MDLTIVTSHWKENLEWLKKSKFPVVLINKEGADPTCFEPQSTVPNRGYETLAYFKYIIENYENLPGHMAFIHGHETSWHQMHDRPLMEVIECANIQKYEYIPLNNFFRYYHFYDEAPNLESAPSGMKLKTLWYRLGFSPIPDGCMFLLAPSSQYIVSKKRILAIPKNVWQTWYQVILNCSKDDELILTVFFDFVQQVIFDGNLMVNIQPDWFSFKYEPKFWHLMPEFCNPKPSSG
jgi:hypothetical protein